MNIKLLEKVKAAILAEPRKLNMATWIVKKADKQAWSRHKPKHSDPPCGTVGCIAGWAVVLDRKQRLAAREGVGETGAKILGLSNTYSALFFVDEWPAAFRDRLETVKSGTKAYAKIVAERIDFFIKTKGTDKEETENVREQQ